MRSGPSTVNLATAHTPKPGPSRYDRERHPPPEAENTAAENNAVRTLRRESRIAPTDPIRSRIQSRSRRTPPQRTRTRKPPRHRAPRPQNQPHPRRNLPYAVAELDFDNPFELLIATVLGTNHRRARQLRHRCTLRTLSGCRRARSPHVPKRSNPISVPRLLPRQGTLHHHPLPAAQNATTGRFPQPSKSS